MKNTLPGLKIKDLPIEIKNGLIGKMFLRIKRIRGWEIIEGNESEITKIIEVKLY